MSLQKFDVYFAQSINAVTHCVFTKKKGDPGMIGPLDRARQWALDNCMQMIREQRLVGVPMLVFHEEMQSPYNEEQRFMRHHVYEIGRFVDLALRSADLFYHEIVPFGMPCKIGFDFELDYTNSAKMREVGADTPSHAKTICERARDEFFEAFCPLLAQACGREQVTLEQDAVHLVCHRRDKWSEHWVFDGARAGLGSIVFKSPVHCAIFVGSLLNDSDKFLDSNVLKVIVDQGIWNRNHPLRTALSSKRGKEQYCFTEPGRARSEMTEDVFVRSLLSCIAIAGNTRELLGQDPSKNNNLSYVTSTFIHQSGLKVPNMIDCSSMLSKASAAALNQGSLPRLFAQVQANSSKSGVSRRDKDRLLLSAAEANMAQQRQSVIDSAGVERASSTTDMHNYRSMAEGTETWFDKLIQSPEIAVYNPNKVIDINGDILVVNCRTKACRYKDKGHVDNESCVYLIVDLKRRYFAQRCHSSNCKVHPSYNALVWHTISAHGTAAIEEFYRTSRPLSSRVGPEIYVAFGRQDPFTDNSTRE
jgi:hypothetical protein